MIFGTVILSTRKISNRCYCANENNNQRCFASLNMTWFVTLAACVPTENCA